MRKLSVFVILLSLLLSFFTLPLNKAEAASANKVVAFLESKGYTNVLTKDTSPRSLDGTDHHVYSGYISSTDELLFLYLTDAYVSGTFSVYIDGKLLGEFDATNPEVTQVVEEGYLSAIGIYPEVTGYITVELNLSVDGSLAMGALAQADGKQTKLVAPSVTKISLNQGSCLDFWFSSKYKDVSYKFAYEVKRGNTLVDSGATSTDVSSVTSFKCKAAGVYSVRVRVIGVGSNSDWSTWKSVITFPVMKEEAIRKSIKKHSVNISWKKVPGAKKYIVYTGKTDKLKKTKTVTKLSYKFNKWDLQKDDLYFAVVAVAEVNGKTIKSQKVINQVYTY